MSCFTRINTRKERDALRQDLIAIKKKRMVIRKESFLRLAKKRVRDCTKTKSYFIKGRSRLRQLKAWKRYDSGENPAQPCKGRLRAEDITLDFFEPVEGLLVVLNKVSLRCDEGKHIAYSQISRIAGLLLGTPHNQKGEGFYRLTLYWDDFSYAHRLIRDLAEDLGFTFSIKDSGGKIEPNIIQDWTIMEGEYKLL